ncbi:MAG: hypothetical protein P8J18_10150 [Halieaceae bacterium]|nr:hypothetical protein [Halieaceae bacterium]
MGVGLHAFGRFPDKDFGELGRVAVNAALKDAGMNWRDVPVMYATAYLNAAGWGTDIATSMGATGIPVINIEAACCSTAAGIVQGSNAISSGAFDIALCVGGEKQPRGFIPALACRSYRVSPQGSNSVDPFCWRRTADNTFDRQNRTDHGQGLGHWLCNRDADRCRYMVRVNPVAGIP